jgi:hypothetical protein
MAMLRIGGIRSLLSIQRTTENKKGRKCNLAAPASNSQRNYKCIRAGSGYHTGAADASAACSGNAEVEPTLGWTQGK